MELSWPGKTGEPANLGLIAAQLPTENDGMLYAAAILVAIGGGLALYALLGGADFGAGVWALLASGPSRDRQRTLISSAIAPVWEANHVWLIFVITGLFAAFPLAFEALSIALYLPFSIALLGIVLRGSAFAFAAQAGQGKGWLRLWMALFGTGSVLSPLALGAAAGAIASGVITVRNGKVASGLLELWTGALPMLTAVLAIVVCAYLAATYLTVEAVGAADRELEDIFRRRALATGAFAGCLAMLGLLVIRVDAELLWRGMMRRGLPFAGLSAFAGLWSMAAMYLRRYGQARIAAALAVAAVLGGWGASQWPYLVPPDITIIGSAAPAAALRAIAISILGGGAILAPSLFLLFKVFKSEPRQKGETGETKGAGEWKDSSAGVPPEDDQLAQSQSESANAKGGGLGSQSAE